MSAKQGVRRVAVLGATGRTGRLVVQEARARGWEVRALVRDEAKVPAAWRGDPAVEVVVGDATVAGSVTELVAGVGAVLDVLGHAKGAPRDVLERSMRLIVAAMRQTGTGRIVVLAGAGARQPDDRIGVVHGVIQGLVRLLRRDLFRDNVGRVRALQATELDWTVCRVTRLVDRRPRHDLYVGPLVPGTKARVTRAAVARWMVEEVAARRHVRGAPVVAERG